MSHASRFKRDWNVYQAQFAKAKPEFSEIRIYAYDKRYTNAIRLDRKNSASKELYDVIRRALLIACNIYLSPKGTATLTKIAEICIRKNHKNTKPEDVEKEVKTAVTAWQNELKSGNLPPVVVSWSKPNDGFMHSSKQLPQCLKGSTVKSLESMTVVLNSIVSSL
jgi:hypothetical protein